MPIQGLFGTFIMYEEVSSYTGFYFHGIAYKAMLLILLWDKLFVNEAGLYLQTMWTLLLDQLSVYEWM